MKTTGLFRRNTVVTSHKRDEDFSDYATVISAEDDPKRLKEYITKLYKAYRDKSKSLRSAYAKLDLLNNEITQEKTRFHDIEDENKSLRDQMQGMADQMVSKEEEFNEWQKQLAEQTKREREVLSEEFEEEKTQLKEQVKEVEKQSKERTNQLEDALNLANLEITRLTIEITELTDPCQTSASDSGTESRSSLEILFTDKKKNFDQDKHELTKQILEITQRRMSLQTELTLVEDENNDLKGNGGRGYYSSSLSSEIPIKDQIRQFYENQTLRRENDELKQQVGRRMFMRSMEDVNLDD